MILQKFGYDVSNLPAVVNDQSLELLVRSFYEGNTMSKFAKQTGIKSTDDLHYLETELFYQADSGCAFNASGATSFAKRTITVGKIKIQQDFCPRDLEGFWTERGLPQGSNYDSIAFESDFTEHLLGLLQEAKEVSLWQSNTSTGTGNLQFYDGFIKIIDDASALTIAGNTGSATGISETNVRDIFRRMWRALPAKLKNKKDVEFMCGSDVFDLLISALETANMFHYDGVSGTPYETGVIILPGTGIKVCRYFGLDGTNRIFLARTSNFVIGTDLESEYDMFNIRLDPVNLKLLLDVHFKEGTQVKFPEEIVQFKLA